MNPGFSQQLMSAFLSAIADSVPFSVPETWAGLLDSTGAELTEPEYARRRIDASTGVSPKWSAPLVAAAEGRVENDTPVVFPTPDGAWPDVHGVALYSASTGGILILQQFLPSPKAVAAGEPVRIPAQAFKLKVVANA